MLKLSKDQKLPFKALLKKACITLLEERIASAKKAMDDAQESANADEKSSAGDKYETSRAMGQLSRDMNAKQMAEAQKELAVVQTLDVSKISVTATIGSVIVTKDLIFFISLGLGEVVTDEGKVMLLSAKAPLALALHDKKAGDTVKINDRSIPILDIF